MHFIHQKIWYLIICLLTVVACKQQQPVSKPSNSKQPIEVKKQPSTTLLREVLDLPACESAVYDEFTDRIYASMIGGKEPKDGGVATVSMDGQILNKQFITGLNDPKGIVVTDDRIYVSDLTELVEADLKTGKILKKYTLEGIEFLNDVTIDAKGTIYVSDTRTSKIYALDSSGSFTLWLADEALDNPNGLLVYNDKMYVASWGNNPAGGRVSKIDMKSKIISTITQDIIGNLDGIRPYDDQHLIISDWRSGNIHKLHFNGTLSTILQVGQSVGDIDYIPEKNRLLLPMNKQSRLLIYEVN